MIQHRAMYAGSFDLLTNGHLWMMHQSLKLFRNLFIVVGDNPNKIPLFTVQERMDMIRESVQSTDYTIDYCGRQLLVDHAKSVGATILIRGIRNPGDAAVELEMCHANRNHDSSITTLFLAPPPALSIVRSSLVKGYLGFEGWEDRVREYVPAPVLQRLREMKERGHAAIHQTSVV